MARAAVILAQDDKAENRSVAKLLGDLATMQEAGACTAVALTVSTTPPGTPVPAAQLSTPPPPPPTTTVPTTTTTTTTTTANGVDPDLDHHQHEHDHDDNHHRPGCRFGVTSHDGRDCHLHHHHDDRDAHHQHAHDRPERTDDVDDDDHHDPPLDDRAVGTERKRPDRRPGGIGSVDGVRRVPRIPVRVGARSTPCAPVATGVAVTPAVHRVSSR